MSGYDIQYSNIVNDILCNGYLDDNRTGVKTKKVCHKDIRIDLEKEFPILTLKKTYFKTAVKEMLWIYQAQSNDIRELQASGCHVWDEWIQEDGTAGKTYGYQVGKNNQIDRLLNALKNDPQDRRMIIDLWNIEDFEDDWNNGKNTLPPCCWSLEFDVNNGRLNCKVNQRSADLGLGLPFDSIHFAVLTHMLAKCSGLIPGMLWHTINNAHLYENQFEAMKEVIKKEPYPSPVLKIADKTNFYDFRPEDFELIDYKCHDAVRMDVVV